MTSHTLTSRLALMRIDRIKQLLQHQVLDVHALADAVFLGRRMTDTYLAHLHTTGEIRIARWARHGGVGRLVACWTLGPGKDAKKPPPLSAAEAQARRRARIDAVPESRARFLAKKRLRDWTPHCDVAAFWIKK